MVRRETLPVEWSPGPALSFLGRFHCLWALISSGATWVGVCGSCGCWTTWKGEGLKSHMGQYVHVPARLNKQKRGWCPEGKHRSLICSGVFLKKNTTIQQKAWRLGFGSAWAEDLLGFVFCSAGSCYTFKIGWLSCEWKSPHSFCTSSRSVRKDIKPTGRAQAGLQRSVISVSFL